MNPRQFAQQIKSELQTVVWPAAGGLLVFGAKGRVAIFAGTPTEEQIPQGFPFALVGIDTGTVDIDDPGLITQQFTVTVAAEVAGDPMGEQAIIGGPITALTKSAGRGVSDLAERARSAVQSLTGADGSKVILSSISLGSPTTLGGGRHLAFADVILEAVCTSAEHYASPQRLRYQATKFVWEGSHCANRFDWFQYRLVKKSGTTPSTDPSDGTVLYTNTAAEYTTANEAGYVYTVFADYASRGVNVPGDTPEASSDPERGSYRVVTS